MKNKLKNIYLPILLFIILLLGMAYFQYIPAKLLKINLETISTTSKIIYIIICDALFMLFVYLLYRKTINKNFKDFFSNFKDNIETSLKYYFIGLAIMVISNLIITIFFSGASANNEEAVRTLIGKYPLYMVFSVSIYAPFIEEIIFRKSIKDMITSYKNNSLTKYLYILTSGLIFASLHVVGMTDKVIDYIYIIPYLSLGIAFAALYHKTDNIFSTICIHSLHNTVSVLLLFALGV